MRQDIQVAEAHAPRATAARKRPIELHAAAGGKSPPLYRHKVIVRCPTGLNVRQAAIVTRLVDGFDCDITLHFNGREANGRSLLGLVILQAGPGAHVAVTTQGYEAHAAMATLVKLFATDFAEAAVGKLRAEH